MLKDEAGFILIGLEISELESKKCHLHIGNYNKKVHVKQIF